jgi:hypothetical protein
VSIRDRAGACATLRSPLICTARALRQLPFVAEQVREVAVAPFGRRGGPDDFQAASDGVGSLAGAVAIRPAEALLFDGGHLRLGADVGRSGGRTMGLAERVTAGDERHRFLVVHRHATERLANIFRGGHGIRVADRSFRIHVDRAHLNSGVRIVELPLTTIALVIEPRALGPTVDLLGFPDILAPAAEAERLESHRLQGAVADRAARPPVGREIREVVLPVSPGESAMGIPTALSAR